QRVFVEALVAAERGGQDRVDAFEFVHGHVSGTRWQKGARALRREDRLFCAKRRAACPTPEEIGRPDRYPATINRADIDMTLDITPLDKAIARLEEALSAYSADTANTLIRDGYIQRFEFTYELAHKMLKRFLERTSPSPEEFDTLSFADLIRSGNERGLLLGDWPRWRTWRSM